MNPAEAVAKAEEIKARLIRDKVIPDPQQTNEHSFEITGRLAYAYRRLGAKLIKKNPGQNGADTSHGRFSHDAIAFTSGGFADALASAGPPANTNRPVWQWEDGAPIQPGQAEDPWDMDAGVVVPPVPPTEPTEPTEPEQPMPDFPALIKAAVQEAIKPLADDVADIKRVQAKGLGGAVLGYQVRLRP